MRGKAKHVPAVGTQPCPWDNTSRYVTAQVQAWARSLPGPTVGHPTPYDGLLIHPESAMEIAAWWHAPGNAFAPFASTGTITEGLAEEIENNIQGFTELNHDFLGVDYPREKGGWVSGDLGTPEENKRELRALLAYVQACEVEVWTVTLTNLAASRSTPRVLSRHLSKATAWEALQETLESALDEYFPDNYPANDCGPNNQECSDSELCARHSEGASIAAFFADESPRHPWPSIGYGIDLADAGLAETLHYEIRSGSVLYGDYLFA